MKKLIVGLVIGAAVGGAVSWWISHPAAGRPATEAPVAKSEETAASNPLHLTADKRTAAGIVVATPHVVALAPEVSAFGRVLDPTPFVALVAEVATARASVAASQKELERAQKLFAAGGNASAQAVETARSAAERDRAALDSAQIRLLAGWGPALANTDMGLIRDALEKGAALVRIDLLPGVQPVAGIKHAQVTQLGSIETYEVQILGPAPVADPQVQGASFLAVLHGHSLPAGATLRVALPGPGSTASGLAVPRDAIVYHEGSAWVYVLGEHDTFERKLVTLGRTADDAVVIDHGVDRDDQVATAGAQQLLSAELASGGTPDER